MQWYRAQDRIEGGRRIVIRRCDGGPFFGVKRIPERDRFEIATFTRWRENKKDDRYDVPVRSFVITDFDTGAVHTFERIRGAKQYAQRIINEERAQASTPEARTVRRLIRLAECIEEAEARGETYEERTFPARKAEKRKIC